MRYYLKPRILKIVSILGLALFFSCKKNNINLTNNANCNTIEIAYEAERIQILFKDLNKKISLIKNKRNEYQMNSQNIMTLPHSINILDSIILSKKVFNKNVLIDNSISDNKIHFNSYNFKINDNLFVRKISFSEVPLYCLKLYYNSDFKIHKIYFQYGDKIIEGKLNSQAIEKTTAYTSLLKSVEKDSLENSANFIEEW